MAMYDKFTYWLVVYGTPTQYTKLECNNWRDLNEAAKVAVEMGIPEGLGMFVIEIDPDTDVDKAIRLEIISHLCDLFGWDNVLSMIYTNHHVPSMN